MIHVLIVANIKLYCEGIAEVLRRSPGIEVVGTASCKAEALLKAVSCDPEVVLLDMAMPDSFDTARAMVEKRSRLRVVALAIPEVESEVVACAEAGVSGYVPREGSLSDLIAAIWSAVRGELRCSPSIAQSLMLRVRNLSNQHPLAGPIARLTSREKEIADRLERGLSNKDIARALEIEVSTVKNHVHNILYKLQVHRRGEAVALLRDNLESPAATAKSKDLGPPAS